MRGSSCFGPWCPSSQRYGANQNSEAMQVRLQSCLQETLVFPLDLLFADGQGVDPGRHDRVREAATETHPGARVVTRSAGGQQPEDDGDGAAAAAAGSLNGDDEERSSHERRLPRARRYRHRHRHSSGSER